MYKQDLMHPNQKCSIGLCFQGPELSGEAQQIPRQGLGRSRMGMWLGPAPSHTKAQRQGNSSTSPAKLELGWLEGRGITSPPSLAAGGEHCSLCSKRQHNRQLISSRTGCMAKTHRAPYLHTNIPWVGRIRGGWQEMMAGRV